MRFLKTFFVFLLLFSFFPVYAQCTEFKCIVPDTELIKTFFLIIFGLIFMAYFFDIMLFKIFAFVFLFLIGIAITLNGIIVNSVTYYDTTIRLLGIFLILLGAYFLISSGLEIFGGED